MNFRLFVPILIVVALGLSACGKSEEQAAQQAPAEPAVQEEQAAGEPATEPAQEEPAAPTEGQ